MAAVKLVRTPYVLTPEQELVLWRTLEALFKPLTAADDKAWRRFWRRLMRAPAHKLFGFEVKEHRNAKFLAKFFVMLGVGYESWDPESDRVKRSFEGQIIRKSFEDFRSDVLILAGFYDVTYSVDGSITRTAKSISFAAMDEEEFEQVYNAVAQVLLNRILTRYSRDDLDRVVGELQGFMEYA